MNIKSDVYDYEDNNNNAGGDNKYPYFKMIYTLPGNKINIFKITHERRKKAEAVVKMIYQETCLE